MTNPATTPSAAPGAPTPTDLERRTVILRHDRGGRFRHWDESSAFLIAAATDADTGAEFVVKGEILAPQVNERYEMFGQMQAATGRFGDTFVFRSARMLLPESTVGIERFLSKTLAKVGPAIAARIVTAYQLDTLRVLTDEPERVAAEISGISPEAAAGISEWLRNHQRDTALRLELEQMLGGIPDLPHKTVDSAIEEWGDDAPAVIKANPYALTELPRIGFKRADEIAITRFGYDRSGIARRKAATLFALREEAATNGHTVLPDSDLIRTVVNLIGHEPGDDALRELAEQDGEIAAHRGDVQLAALAEAEQTIADRIKTLNANPIPPSELFNFFNDPELKDEQANAAHAVNVDRVAIITGAPGVGKTWTVARIVAIARAAGYSVRLAAPTGKAAKRLTESLASCGGGTATTLHRLLGATIREKTGEWDFVASRKNPFSARTLFVVDEFSMVETVMAAKFFDAVHDDSRVLLVGDMRQLPSIGAGAVLRDLIASETLPHAELTKIKRNAGDLVLAIHAIKDGQLPKYSAKLELPDRNIRMRECGADEIHQTMLDTITKLGRRGFDPIWDVQVMSPLNEKGPQSCDALNPLLSQALNPAAESHRGLAFRIGDKIVRTKNGTVAGRYHNAAEKPEQIGAGEAQVVNGDLGRVEEITDKEVTVRHWSPDRTVNYSRRDHKLRLAYCLTVHKMQGSSAPVTILPMHESFVGPIWTREWIYTAISRAEQACVLIGSEDVARRAVQKPSGNRRKTRLLALLRATRDTDGDGEKVVSETPSSNDINAALNAAADEQTVDWFDSHLAELPLHPDGRVETLEDGRRVWLHPEERL